MYLIIFWPRFLLIFVVCLLSLFGKAAAITNVFFGPYNNKAALGEKDTVLAIVFATQFLPGLLLGIISCWHKDIFKTIVAHPSVVLMPAFTGYSFKKEKEKETGEPFIVFSPKMTLLNTLLSILGIVVHGQSLAPINDEDYIASLPPRILAPLLTLLSLPLISRHPRCRSLAKHILANLIFNLIALPIFYLTTPPALYYLPIPILGLLVSILKVILVSCPTT